MQVWLLPWENRETVSERPSGQIERCLDLMFFIISLLLLYFNIKEGMHRGVEKDYSQHSLLTSEIFESLFSYQKQNKMMHFFLLELKEENVRSSPPFFY